MRDIWFLIFGALIANINCQSTNLPEANNVTESANTIAEEQLINELRDYLENKIRQLKLDFHKKFETDRIRKKRDAGLMMTLPQENGVHPEDIQVTQMVDQQREDDVEPASQSIGEYPISCWTSISFGNNQLVFIITSQGEVILLSFDGKSFDVVLKLVVEDPAYKAKAFKHGDEIWFVVAHGSQSDLIQHYVQLYVFDGQTITKKQIIPTKTLSEIDLIHFRGYWYLAVGTMADYVSLEGNVLLYQWKHTQFDLIAKHASKGIRSIVMWSYSGVLYLGVARSIPGEVSYGSAIYAFYGGSVKKLVYLQLISTVYAYRIVHFVVDGNNYVSFLCTDGVHLYWWAGSEFIFYQLLEDSEGAIDIDSLLLPNGEVALAVGFRANIAFFTEDYLSRYVKTYHLELDHKSLDEAGVAGLKSAKFFSRLGAYYYVFLTYEGEYEEGYKQPANFYKLNLTAHLRHMEEKLDPLTSCIVNLNHSLSEKQRELNAVAPKIEHIWVTDKEQTVMAPVIVKGNVRVGKDFNPGTIIVTHPNETLPQLTNSALHLDILDSRTLLDALKADSKNLVYKSKEQTIYGPIRFLAPPLIRNGHLGALVNPSFLLNGMPMARLIEASLKVNGLPQVFAGNLIINGQLSVGQMSCDGSLNGLQTQNLFLLNSPDVYVTGDLIFANVSTDGVTMQPDGMINDIQPRHFVRNDGQIQVQVIEGTKTFLTLKVAKETTVHGETNGRKLADLSRKIIYIHDNPNILSEYDYTTPLVVDGDLIIGNLINGHIDLSKLANEAVMLDQPDKEVFGRKVFKSPVFVEGDVTVDGLTNGVDVSEDIVTRDTPQTITGHITFKKPVHFLGDLDTGLINGIDLSEQAVVVSAGPQTVTGIKRFLGNLEVAGDVTMTDGATINGIDLSELSRSVLTPNNFTVYGQTVFDYLGVKYVDKMHVVNGINLQDLDATLWRKSADQTVLAPLEFNVPVVIENDLEVGVVNGLSLDIDFLHTSGDEEITGSFTFAEDFYLETPLLMADGITLNGYDISEYNRSLLSLNQPCEVHGSKTFPSLDILGNVIIRGQLNGLKPSRDLLLKNEVQDVHGHYSFNYPTTKITGNLFADNLDITTYINGLDFAAFAHDVVLIDDPRPIPMENKHFVGSLKTNNVNALGLISGIDINALREEAIPLKSRGFLAFPHNFTDVVFQGDVYAARVNGFPFEEFLNRLIYQGEPVIRGPKTITGSLIVNGNLVYEGFLNGVNLGETLNRVAYLHGDNVFTEPLTFRGGIVADNVEISPNSVVDGIPWSDLVYLNGDEVLSGYNRFLDDIVVEKDLVVHGLINGCDLNKLASLAVYNNAVLQRLTGSNTIGNLIVHGNLEVINGIGINGIDLEALALSTVTMDGENQILTGPIHFKNGLIVDSLTLNSPINGIDLSFILGDAVSKTAPQIIDGHKQFIHPDGVHFNNGLMIEGDFNPSNLVNGVNIRGVHDSAVLWDAENRNVFGVKTFRNVVIRGDVYVMGTINGVSVPNDLVLKSTNEVVPVHTHFASPTLVRGDLVLHRTVDGVDLDHFIHSRATLAHDEVFSADVTFENKVNIDWLEVMGAINDIPASSIVLKSSDVRIGGRKIFTGDVYVDADFNALTINEINIPEFEKRVVRVNRHEIITAPTIFMQPIEVHRDIIVKSNINGHAVDTIRDKYLEYWHSLSDVAGRLTAMTEAQEYQVRRQFEAQKHGFIHFAHFDLIQTLEHSMTRMFTYPSYNSLTMEPSQLLYGWTPSNCDADNECCTFSTLAFNLDKYGLPTLINSEQNGRIIPLEFKYPQGVLPETFYFWTNTTSSSHDCVGPYAREESAVLSSNIHTYETRYHMIIPDSAYVQDVISFDTNEAHYVIVAYSFDKRNGNPGVIEIYKYVPSTNYWSSHQTIPSPGIVDLDLAIVGYDIFLATAAGKPGVSLVFKWVNGEFMVMNQLPSSWPKCVLWINIDNNLFLALGNERQVEGDDIPIYTEPIVIYQYDFSTSTLQWYQHVSVQGAVDITMFKIGGETYLLSASRADHMVSIIQWKGYSGFRLKDEFPVPLVNDLQLYWSHNEQLFLIISTEDCRTLIMKATTVGQGLSPLEGRPYYPDYDLLIKENAPYYPS